MLSSITPLGERGRAGRWSVTVTAYVVGSLLGGAALGSLAGLAGALLPFEVTAVAVGTLALLAIACGLAVLVERGRLPRLPTVRRQVDEDWLHRYRGWVYGLGFGVQLGLGVVTIVTSPTVYLVVVLAVLTGSPAAGAVVGLVFGLTRAVPVLTTRRVTTTAQLAAAHQRLEARAPTGQTLAALTLAAVAAASAVQAVVLAGAA